MPPDRRLVTNALLAMLRAEQPKQIGDGQVPTPTVLPYAVLYVLDGGGYNGTQGLPESRATLPYQVTAVGRLRQEAEDMAAVVIGVVCGRAAGGAFVESFPAIAGLKVIDRRLTGAPGAVREGELFNAPVLFVLDVAPA